MTRIAVIGAGAWGTALATVARRNGHDVMMWAYEPDVAKTIAIEHENPVYMPGTRLDPEIGASNDLTEAAKGAEIVLLAVPAQNMRAIVTDLRPELPKGVPLVICAKGIEEGTGALMSEAVADAAPGWPLAVLSGPTFAAEVAQGLPSAVTLAAEDENLAMSLVETLGGKMFRPYAATDVTGAQIGGAVKNVVAIACGIVLGKELGENARAALITRGLAEMGRLSAAKGAKSETLMGLSGLGDLTLTCNSLQSRNMSLGAAIGQGERLDAILSKRRSVAEGVFSARSVAALAETMGVDMPIVDAVNAILHRGAGVDETIQGLLSRPFKTE